MGGMIGFILETKTKEKEKYGIGGLFIFYLCFLFYFSV